MLSAQLKPPAPSLSFCDMPSLGTSANALDRDLGRPADCQADVLRKERVRLTLSQAGVTAVSGRLASAFLQQVERRSLASIKSKS